MHKVALLMWEPWLSNSDHVYLNHAIHTFLFYSILLSYIAQRDGLRSHQARRRYGEAILADSHPHPRPSHSSNPINRNPPPPLEQHLPNTLPLPFKRRLGTEAHRPHESAHKDRKADKHDDCAWEKNRFFDDERLSSEGHEADPFEVKRDDIIVFGIDIMCADNKTIIHHKVTARVVCMFTMQDA
ncbi:hypothetical protein CVT25_008819 [Psilocybe cyanescens]|uniref:Uncharacterized protein n=1 Tax=Psilocybe cyanescens TaxID=93625 RepID=A0A409W116_PSICY|nr:hypothetical protein CVT25_008819 [Psilocybe cyanescens]